MYKFLGIGAQKAGTTWLYEMLKQHPQISFPLKKEVHYWNNKYPNLSPNIYYSNFLHPDLYEGEITPAYALLDSNTIQKIYSANHDLRIIYILRNPIDRAWSSAKMALKRAEMDYDEASDQWFIDHFNSRNSRLRGDYEACIRNWRLYFPSNNILTLQFEEIKSNPESFLNKCCSHIGINPFTNKQLASMDISTPVFSTHKTTIKPRLQAELLNIYLKKIKGLERYLNLDLSSWYK